MDELYYVYFVKKNGTRRKVHKQAFDCLTDAEKYYKHHSVTETDLLYISLSWGTSILKENIFM